MHKKLIKQLIIEEIFPPQCRLYTTLNINNKHIPILIYKNAFLDKDFIIKENKNKSGVYMWKNMVNDKMYIGGAINLGHRFSKYYLDSYLQKQLSRGNSAIYRAILKYGYPNFQVWILEYCKPSDVIKIEQKYIDLYKPKYNILLIAGSRLGHKLSSETKALIRIGSLGRKNKHTIEGRAKIAAAQGIPVTVLDLKTNEVYEYISIAAAARSFNTYPKAI